jgi:hypothetical protein
MSEEQGMLTVATALRDGMALAKCRRCGCMQDALDGIMEGRDARSIYWMAIEQAWAGVLSHAAYLGKAELALKTGSSYAQDGA